ncbi:hypothetical protein HAP48_0034940 [Bradyrhizobium septentrionale]|uniref:Phage tail collar domain-containing protein n=1 Tax=Bradyrhizobium septentrionale TaxID=1404411 RepID=A0A974A1S5_9BRAD|nr:hypothetical protein [Bradyrhizobium septentrionale]UGY13730.1 hypothetical protein HAP48_0034940 [Bradyrhizobium septentrionale]
MKYQQPYGVSDPNAAYTNGNPSTGIMGSIPPAASIEFPQREIVNFITDAGLVPADGDLHQLSRSVQSGHVIYGVDSGAANLLSIALTPPLIAYVDGLFVWVRVAVTNTGPAVLSINGLAGKNIVRRGGTALQAGDLPGSYLALLVYNGPHGNFELYGASFAPATFVPILSANTNLYCNPATGDDALYDGSAAVVSGPHGPFRTIARAMQETFKYGPSVYTMTINLSSGTFNEAVGTPNVIGPTIIIKGNGPTATFVMGANNAHTFSCTNANNMIVRDLCTQTGTGSGPPCNFAASSGGSISTINTASQGATAGYIFEAYGGYVYPGNHTFNAGSSCQEVFAAFFSGFVGLQQGASYNFAGSMNVTAAIAVTSSNGSIAVPVPGAPTFPGAGFVTGQKYFAALNGVINTQGSGASYFPGNQPGVVSSGGQYN